MEELIRELEELSFRTLPAFEQERYDGWVLRWSDGGSRRGNSVNPVGTSSIPLGEKIRYCEEWLGRRDAGCVFRLTPVADRGLSEELFERGYRPTSPTDVMTLAIGDPVRRPDVDVTNSPSSGWLRIVTGLDAHSIESSRLAAQLTAGGGRLQFATVLGAGREVEAAGLSVDLDRYTTIYNVIIIKSARRRGIATAIVTTLLAIGMEAGSTHAVLQVTQDNGPAQALYRGLGFSPAYQYAYMEPPAQG